MGEVKELLNNVKKKKWGKEEWIILILIGVFLLIVFLPDSKQKETKPEENHIQTESNGQFDSQDTYKEQMEQQLEDMLKTIEGIDVVNAMITFSTSEEDVLLLENEHTMETTVEEDSQGGNRKIESDSTKETVYTEKRGDNNSPYITHTIAPRVEGVLIVVGGNRAGLLKPQIVRAVQALFDVESHKVVIIKMKE